MVCRPGERRHGELALCLEWGYPVDLSGEEARLRRDPDTLVPAWIVEEAEPLLCGALRVIGFLELTSTNDEARRCAERGDAGGVLVYAESQTAGRGRMGRRWESPPHAGLYFTLMVRPEQPQAFWPLLTQVAAVALARTLKEIPYRRPPVASPVIDIKWPNDVLLYGKKTAGILLEVVSDREGCPAALVGVGVNVSTGWLPPELEETATSLREYSDRADRRKLLVRFLRHFDAGYAHFQSGSRSRILEQWMEHSSMSDGMQVEIRDGTRIMAGITCGLSDLGALRIRTPDGRIELIFAGDLRVVRRRKDPQ